MRAYYFFMKFIRGFAIGFRCGLCAAVLIAAAVFAVSRVYF